MDKISSYKNPTYYSATIFKSLDDAINVAELNRNSWRGSRDYSEVIDLDNHGMVVHSTEHPDRQDQS